MVRRLLTNAAIAGLAFMLAGGFSIQTLPRGPFHPDDPAWGLLAGATFTLDGAKGLYVANFPAAIRQLSGKPFKVMGYMMPLGTDLRSNHFVVLRRSPGCPFCPPNAVGEAVEVFSKSPVQYTDNPVTVEGTLQLEQTSVQGLFFALSKASVSCRGR